VWAVLILLPGLCSAASASQVLPESTWYEKTADNTIVLHFYFFRSSTCPHCNDAIPYVHDIIQSMDYVKLHDHQLIGNREAVVRYQLMATAVGEMAQSVPAFLFCNSMTTGFSASSTPALLRQGLAQCRKYIQDNGSLQGFTLEPVQPRNIVLPLLGEIDIQGSNSILLITTGIAALDAFNPCAFFVLMFLMSLMLHTGSRGRMLLVGCVFVLISGLLYFMFMAAWLNLFRAIGQMQVITVAAGLIALLVAIINIKDYFWFKRGVSLSISDGAKPGLYQRMRGLLQARSLTMLLFATVTLALFANLYELLCTAGFPMVYTRILTLNDLPVTSYYLYLALYNLIYVIPLFVIVLLFAWSMGGRKMQEREGRRLKLVSGNMMLVLGLILVLNPAWLQDVVLSLSALLAAVILSLLIMALDRSRHQRMTPGPGE
jgi:hypothetical protein